MRIQSAKRKTHAWSEDSGFTLIELLLVLLILGILVAIAVPSGLGFKDRANNSAAQANVRSAVSAVETYHADNGTYAGMDLNALRQIDASIKLSAVGSVSDTDYCIEAVVGGKVWSKAGPAAPISSGACP